MIILSSFNADYLKKPLQFLIDQFIEDEKVDINYGNIITSLIDIQKFQTNSIIFLLRLTDLVNFKGETDGEKIDISKLERNLERVVDAIVNEKKNV